MASENKSVLGALLAALLSASAAAQQVRPSYSYPPLPPPDKGGIQLGQSPFYASGFVGAAAGYDDNVLLSARNERSSTLYIVSPGLKLDARSANSVFQASYQAQAGRYSSSGDDNYVDHGGTAQYDIAFSSRSFLKLGYAYARGHDPRGATDRPILGDPDEFRTSAPSVIYAFGAPGARGRVELFYSGEDREYLNNRASTARSDREADTVGGAFYVRVAPKTYAVAEVRETRIQFDLRNPADGKERRYLGGVSWLATAATTGTLKVGQLRRTFDNGDPDVKTTSWEGVVNWAPRTYSTVDLFTSRHTTEATGVGRFIVTSATSLVWNHGWTSRFSTAVSARFQKDDYEGVDRVDDVSGVGFKVGYRLRRWLVLGAEYSHTRRDSNVPGLDYRKNVYLLTATGSI